MFIPRLIPEAGTPAAPDPHKDAFTRYQTAKAEYLAGDIDAHELAQASADWRERVRAMA